MEDFRKLVLGKFYNRCKHKQVPVSNLFLSQRLSELQGEGYLKGCELDDLISMCEFKPVEKTCLQYIPTNLSSHPSMGEENYKKLLKQLDLDDVKTSDEPLECPICLEELDEENRPIERLSPCGHYVHHSCIFNTSKAMGRSPFCPICKENVTNVSTPSHGELIEAKRQLAAQYNRALGGNLTNSKQEQFRLFVLSKTYITQPYINTQKLVTEWNLHHPNNQITSLENSDFKEIARSAYKDRFRHQFDPDVDEMKDFTLKEMYDMIVENILQYIPVEKARSLGPLEIEDMWNHHSIYTIDLKNYIPLYEELNSYRLIADKKYKVNKQFNELYQQLINFDYTNNTDISSRVKIKYDSLREKEDKKGLEPGTLVEKEIFNKPFDKLTKTGCVLM